MDLRECVSKDCYSLPDFRGEGNHTIKHGSIGFIPIFEFISTLGGKAL